MNINIYKCKFCLENYSNLIEYCNHIKLHHSPDFNFSTEILQYLIDYKIEPYQWEDNEGNLHLSYNLNDIDVLLMVINDIEHEEMSIDILNLLNTKNNLITSYFFDDTEKLRKYLISKNIINDNDDLYKNIDKYSYNEWENFCHFTNNSLLMHCIKKKWNRFCLRLLDFNVMYNINYQNITNAYEMAINYELYDVAEKIKNDKRFTLCI
jgi:hypothetical protein